MSNFTYPWKVQDGDSERHYQLAIPAGAQKLVISFEYSAPELPGQITSIMGLRWPALRKRHQLLVGYQINKPNSRRNIDDGKGGLHGGKLRGWSPASYHAELSIDLQKGGFTFVEAGDQIAGSISAFPVSPIPGAAVTPATLDLSFGQTGIADGAYYPPLGFTFYKVSVTLDAVPIVVDPGPAANTIPAPPPVVVAPPPPTPPAVIVAPPPPPPPVVVTPPPAPGGVVPPDATGIAAAIASIYARSGDAGLLAILDGMLAVETGNPAYADLIGLVRVLISGQAPDSAMVVRLASGFASKLPEPWPELVPVIVASMGVKP